MNLVRISQRLVDALSLGTPPIALAFTEQVPANVPHVQRRTPSGCTFWSIAAQGETFYTEPRDHYGCPIGAHTHGLPLSGESVQMLGAMIGMMAKLDYLREAEVPAIPTLKGGFHYAVYSPLAASPVVPDVVILHGNARQLMLASEAARAAGLEGTSPVRERPTCSMIAEVMESGRGRSSFACIGNRVYTALDDSQVYFALPGGRLEEFADKLEALVVANRELEAFHRGRLPSPGEQ